MISVTCLFQDSSWAQIGETGIMMGEESLWYLLSFKMLDLCFSVIMFIICQLGSNVFSFKSLKEEI